MDAIHKPKLTGNAYFDPHSWEFSDSTSEKRQGLIKIPIWCPVLLSPIMGLLYVICIPPFLVCTVAVTFPSLLRKMIRRFTAGANTVSPREVFQEPAPGNIKRRHPVSTNQEDRDLAQGIIEELEMEFTARRRRN